MGTWFVCSIKFSWLGVLCTELLKDTAGWKRHIFRPRPPETCIILTHLTTEEGLRKLLPLQNHVSAPADVPG